LLFQTAEGLNYRATDILVWITATFLRNLHFVTTAVITHFAHAPANQSCEVLLQWTQKATRRFLFMVFSNALALNRAIQEISHAAKTMCGSPS
jgi:hypothetical protein